MIFPVTNMTVSPYAAVGTVSLPVGTCPRPFRPLLIGLTLLALSFLSVTPTHAGSWSVTYDTAGTNTGEIDRGQSAEYLVGVPWEVASPSNHIFLDMTSPPWGSELDDIRTEGDVTAVLTWTGGPGDNPPATIYVRETASATSFPHGFPIQVYDAGGLTPVVATTDDGLGDSPKLSAPADEWSASSGSHLTQISTQGQRVVRLPKHHMLASIHYDDPLAYDAGLDGEQEYVNVDYSAALDTRAVTVSADTGSTTFKTLSGGVDANGDGLWRKDTHTPDSDGTMKADIGIPYGERHTTTATDGPGSVVTTSSNLAVTYTAHIPGRWATQNGQYLWNSSLKNWNESGTLYHVPVVLAANGPPVESEIDTVKNVYVGPVVDSDDNGAIIPNEVGANGTTDHIFFKFQNGDNRPNYPTGNDGDGATGTANYYLTLHQSIEVFPSNKLNEIKFRVASPDTSSGDIPMSFQGLDYSTYKGSGSNGISALCVLNSPSVYWSIAGDVTSVLSSVPYPGWWGVLDVIFTGANIAINHDTPVQQSFAADFNDVAWSDPQSDGDPNWKAGRGTKADYHMSPRVRVNYRWRYKLVDVYDASGFKSETLAHDEGYVGPQDAFGFFSYAGPTL